MSPATKGTGDKSGLRAAAKITDWTASVSVGGTGIFSNSYDRFTGQVML
jgi:hypothetical protein